MTTLTDNKAPRECSGCKQEFERGLSTRNEFLNFKIKTLQSRLEKCEALILDALMNYSFSKEFENLIKKYFAEVEGE